MSHKKTVCVGADGIHKRIQAHPFDVFRIGLLLVLSLVGSATFAQTATVRYQQNIVGGASMFGNSWFYAPNDDFAVLVPDADDTTALGAQSTHSTYADLILPPGSTIVKAYLYTEMASYNIAAGEPVMTSVKLAAPGDASYTTLTSASAGFLAARTVNGIAYSAVDFRQMAWDITSRINPTTDYSTSASGGTAGRFYLADPLPLPRQNDGQGEADRMGGWSIIVVYTNPNSNARSVTVADAWSYYNGTSITTNVPNVQVPSSGPVVAVVGATGTYGDRGYSDLMQFGRAGSALTSLADPMTGSTTDAMNSSIAWSAVNNVAADGGPALSGSQTTRSNISAYHGYGPAETWEYDSDIYNASGILPNSATPINVQLRATSTSNDVIVGGAYFVSIDIALPELTKALSPASIADGGVATYTWTIDNTITGGVNMTGAGFTDALPSSIIVATPNGATTTCTGGSVTATPGSATVTLSGASINVGQICTVTVNVTNVAGQTNADCTSNPAAFTNSSSNITASSNLANMLTPVCLVVLPKSTVTITKVSNGGVGSFDFTGTNGIAAQTLTTTVAGTAVSGTPQVLTTAGAATTITEAALAGYFVTDIACTGLGAGGTATANNKTRTVTLDAAATVAGSNIICTFTNSRQATVRLQKTWVNAIVGDFARVTGSGTGPNNPASYAFNLDSIANTPNETDSGGANVVAVGDVITLSEILGPPAVGTYTSSAFACTGGGSLSGNTLTIGAADAGGAITCAITNTGKLADLAITKTNTPVAGPNDQSGDTVIAGTGTTYAIVVTNNGPDAVTGATIRDPAPSGLTCSDPVTCTGSGCPAATVPLSSLQGSGIVLGTLANGGTVTFSMSCTVQ